MDLEQKVPEENLVTETLQCRVKDIIAMGSRESMSRPSLSRSRGTRMKRSYGEGETSEADTYNLSDERMNGYEMMKELKLRLS